MSDENVPLVLPDWLNTSEVSYAAGRIGVVKWRGQTIKAGEDIRGKEGTR